MHHGEQPSDWVAYAVVIGVVALMMLGKYLMASGDNKSDNSKENKE